MCVCNYIDNKNDYVKEKAIADSGCTSHFWRTDSKCRNIKLVNNDGVKVLLPNTNVMKSTHTGNIPFDGLSSEATKVQLFPDLRVNLISLGQLCDDGCIIHLQKRNIKIYKHNKILMKGERNKNNGMWEIEIGNEQNIQENKHIFSTDQPQQANSGIYEFKKKGDIINFLHGCAFSPVKTAWIKAVKNNYFTTWPGLSDEAIRKHLGKVDATVKGHQTQTRQNVRSTQPKQLDIDHEPKIQTETDNVYATIMTKKEIFTDLTGRFPIKSSKGNQYIFILYAYDQNAILSRPIKNREKGTIKTAYKYLLKYLQRKGLHPKLQKLDNEVSTELKEYMEEEGIDYQLVPPPCTQEKCCRTSDTDMETPLYRRAGHM